MSAIPKNELVAFLFRAKKELYQDPFPLHIEKRSYSEGSLVLQDCRIGEKDFVGEEILYENGKPCWAMNYLCRRKEGNTDALTEILKQALTRADKEKPYRGPAEYRAGGYVYTCNTSGGPDWFYGYEWITFGGQTIYEYAFHGGSIS